MHHVSSNKVVGKLSATKTQALVGGRSAVKPQYTVEAKCASLP